MYQTMGSQKMGHIAPLEVQRRTWVLRTPLFVDESLVQDEQQCESHLEEPLQKWVFRQEHRHRFAEEERSSEKQGMPKKIGHHLLLRMPCSVDARAQEEQNALEAEFRTFSKNVVHKRGKILS